MKLNLKALSLAVAILWGGSFFAIGLVNLGWPSYGLAWLELGQAIYPGYTPGGFGSVIVATLYGMLDGAVVGALFGWIYNKVAGMGSPATAG